MPRLLTTNEWEELLLTDSVCFHISSILLDIDDAPGSLQLSYLAVALLLARSALERDLPLAVLRTAQESAFKVTEQVIAFVTSLNEEDLKGYWTICKLFFVVLG